MDPKHCKACRYFGGVIGAFDKDMIECTQGQAYLPIGDRRCARRRVRKTPAAADAPKGEGGHI